MYQVTAPSIEARISPGMMPAMNSAPIEELVDTPNKTRMIDGGTRVPSAPEVAITPAPKRLGKPCSTIAGMMIEPIATTVATLEPLIAANKAQAATPASPNPPGQWPTSETVKLIMRLATPPRVRNVPARMKNGIAMIPKLSRPLNSLRPTLSIGTCVIVNRKVSTVRPSEIEIGMPVSIKANRMTKISSALIASPPSTRAMASGSTPSTWVAS